MITSSDEYRQKLLEIQNSTTVTLSTLPSDEPRFLIDANSRTIQIPSEFSFLGVKGDHKAETIYFEIDRFFDSEDLSQHTCIVQFVNESNEGIYPVTQMDVTSCDGKIIFGWTIENCSTIVPGKIDFSIRFYTIENGYYTYNWNSLVANSNILDTLDVNESSTTILPSELSAWTEKMDETSKQADNTLSQANKIKTEMSEELAKINIIQYSDFVNYVENN